MVDYQNVVNDVDETYMGALIFNKMEATETVELYWPCIFDTNINRN